MIILDTHVWLWLLHDPSQLSNAAREQIEIEEAQDGILVSAISVWEIAVKSSLQFGRSTSRSRVGIACKLTYAEQQFWLIVSIFDDLVFRLSIDKY